jgi:hypothetical protein
VVENLKPSGGSFNSDTTTSKKSKISAKAEGKSFGGLGKIEEIEEGKKIPLKIKF